MVNRSDILLILTETTMPSLNHSYICLQILRQLVLLEKIEPLPELTLEITNGLTPDISVFPKGQLQANLFHDVTRVQQMPMLAIEVISSFPKPSRFRKVSRSPSLTYVMFLINEASQLS